MFLRSAIPDGTVTTNAHASVMEPWAGSRLIPLKFIEFAVLGTFGKLRLLHLLICLQLQRYDFSFTFRHIFENILWTHRKLYVWGFNIIDSIYGFLCPPYEEVGLRQVFVGDDEAQGICTGYGLSTVRRLYHICHRLPCRWTTRGECEGGNQEEEKFCLFHFAFMDTGERNSSRI